MPGSPEATHVASASSAPSPVTTSPVTNSSSRHLERDLIVRRAGLVGLGTLASRVLGLGRDVVLAMMFSRRETDAFSLALTIPNALRQLLAEGSVSSAVVPILSNQLATGGDSQAKAFFARARGVSWVALLAVTALGMIFAESLTDLFAPGFRRTPGQLELTTTLTRLMFPYLLFVGTAALGAAALNAKGWFGVAAFTPGLFNVAVIVSAFLLRAPLAARGFEPVVALGVGVLLGGVLQVAAQWPALAAIGYAGRPSLDFRDPCVAMMLRRVGPTMLGLGIYYVDLTLSRRFLSGLGDGAQSYFYFASRLCDFPQGIFVMALSTASLPSLSTYASQGNLDEMRATWAHGFRLAMFVALPCSVGLAVLAHPLVSLLLQRGLFDNHAAYETARSLAWQGGAIFTVAAVRQLVPAFYALGDTRTPVVVSALDLLAFVILALTLRGPYGHSGISMAVAGSSAVQMILLLVWLRRRLGSLRGKELASSLARIAAASAVAACGAWGTVRLVETGIGGNSAPAIAGGIGFVVFGGVYGAMCWGLGVREIGEVMRAVVRKTGRSHA